MIIFKAWKCIFIELEYFGIVIRQSGQTKIMKSYIKHLEEELLMTKRFLLEDKEG